MQSDEIFRLQFSNKNNCIQISTSMYIYNLIQFLALTKKDKINKLGVNNAAKKHKNFCWSYTCQKLIRCSFFYHLYKNENEI